MPTLNWLDREASVKAAEAVPFRILDFDPALSAGDPAAENLMIQGDNLDALKAITPYFAGRVKCIAIDPPYNTGTAWIEGPMSRKTRRTIFLASGNWETWGAGLNCRLKRFELGG